MKCWSGAIHEVVKHSQHYKVHTALQDELINQVCIEQRGKFPGIWNFKWKEAIDPHALHNHQQKNKYKGRDNVKWLHQNGLWPKSVKVLRVRLHGRFKSIYASRSWCQRNIAGDKLLQIFTK